jgi:protein-disulfide isomerase
LSVLSPPVGSDDHLLGNPDAGVSLLEYGDYECPFCGQAQPLVHAVLRRLGNRLTLAYRHFPMSNAHPHAMLAATAAEAAGLQGQFWEMHETLFQNQDALELDDLLGYARELGLDLRRFASDMTGEACVDKVRRERDAHVLHRWGALRRTA